MSAAARERPPRSARVSAARLHERAAWRSAAPYDQAGRRGWRRRTSPDIHSPQEPHQCLSLHPINWSPRSTRCRVPSNRIKHAGSVRQDSSRSSAPSLKSSNLAADPQSSIGTARKTRWSMSLPGRSPSSRARPRQSCAPVASRPSEPASRSGTIWRIGAPLKHVAWSLELEPWSIRSPTRSTIGFVCEIDRCQTTDGPTWRVDLHPARTNESLNNARERSPARMSSRCRVRMTRACVGGGSPLFARAWQRVAARHPLGYETVQR